MTTGRICVGAIAGSFGLQGEVRLKSFCSVPEAIATYGALTTEDGTRSFTVRLTRPVANGLGVAIVSTPKGVMPDWKAREQNVGGEVLCNIF